MMKTIHNAIEFLSIPPSTTLEAYNHLMLTDELHALVGELRGEPDTKLFTAIPPDTKRELAAAFVFEVFQAAEEGKKELEADHYTLYVGTAGRQEIVADYGEELGSYTYMFVSDPIITAEVTKLVNATNSKKPTLKKYTQEGFGFIVTNFVKHMKVTPLPLKRRPPHDFVDGPTPEQAKLEMGKEYLAVELAARYEDMNGEAYIGLLNDRGELWFITNRYLQVTEAKIGDEIVKYDINA